MRPGTGADDERPAHDIHSTAAPLGAVPLSVSDRGVVTVAGDIDMLSAPVLAEHLRRHLVARPGELVIDLSGVLHLGAAAMAVLVDTATLGAQHGITVTVVAPPGSAAHRVITLTELGDFLRLRSAVGDNHDLSPARHRSSLDVHNPGVDEEAARMGACGQLHLPTGRTCTREHGHPGSCDFVSREHMEESLARHRARDRW